MSYTTGIVRCFDLVTRGASRARFSLAAFLSPLSAFSRPPGAAGGGSSRARVGGTSAHGALSAVWTDGPPPTEHVSPYAARPSLDGGAGPLTPRRASVRVREHGLPTSDLRGTISGAGTRTRQSNASTTTDDRTDRPGMRRPSGFTACDAREPCDLVKAGPDTRTSTAACSSHYWH